MGRIHCIEREIREVGTMEKNGDLHSFTAREIAARFDACRGKTLGEIDQTGVFPGKPKNKGVAGDVIEQSVLGYPADSRQEPDIEIDGTEYEVKTTGVIRDRKSGGYVAKEPMSITAVSVDRIWREEFQSSAFWHKLGHMLIAYYLYNEGRATKVDDTLEYAKFPFLGYELHEWSEGDRGVLESDWRLVRDFVERVHVEGLDPDTEYPRISHELNKQLMYTDTAPKWPNPPRWRLKRSAVSALVEHCLGKGLESLPNQFSSYSELERICRDLRVRFGGETVTEIAQEVGFTGDLGGKSVNEGLIVRMFGGTAKRMSKIDAFAKAGIRCVSVVYANGKARMAEDTKFSRIDFDEVVDTSVTWEESSALESFCSRVLCAVFEEPSLEAPLRDNVFLGFKWIYLNDEVVAEARKVWEEVRRLILSNELEDIPSYRKDGTPIINKTGVMKSAPNFPKSKDAYAVFVRGDSGDSTKKPLTINGVSMYRQYFWLKRSLIAGQLQENDFI